MLISLLDFPQTYINTDQICSIKDTRYHNESNKRLKFHSLTEKYSTHTQL